MPNFTEESLQSDQSWALAAKVAEPLIKVPSLFSTAVRSIIKVASEGEGLDQDSLRAAAASKAAFLIGVSPTLKAVLYFAAKSLHPNDLLNQKELDYRKLMKLFPPEELAMLIGVSYMYRRVGKLVEAAEWQRLAKTMNVQMRVGALVGETIQHVGSGYGMLIGAMRYISLGMFALKDLKNFQKYRRQCEKEGRLFDTKAERAEWRCDHLQVASILVQRLGFGMPRHPAAMALGLDALNVGVESLPRNIQEPVLCFQIALGLAESYHATGKAPTAGKEVDTAYLPPEEAEDLERRVAVALKDQNAPEWLASSPDKLPREIADQLGIAFKEVEVQEESAAWDAEAGEEES